MFRVELQSSEPTMSLHSDIVFVQGCSILYIHTYIHIYISICIYILSCKKYIPGFPFNVDFLVTECRVNVINYVTACKLFLIKYRDCITEACF